MNLEHPDESTPDDLSASGAPCGKMEQDLLVGARILVVEDDRLMTEMLTGALGALRAEVKSASSVEEALPLLGACFDLIITDVNLPGLSGLELLPRVRALSPNTRVVVVSGMADMHMMQRSLREGATDFLRKPFELTEFTGAVRSALEKGWLQEVNHLHGVGQRFLDGRSLEHLHHTAVESLQVALGASGAALLLPSGESRGGVFLAASSGQELRTGLRALDIGARMLGAFASGEPPPAPVVGDDFLLQPLLGEEACLGAVLLEWEPDRPPPGYRDLRRTALLADHLALALVNSDRIQRLLSADRMLTVGELTASVTHEINNALAFMISNLAFVNEEIGALAKLAETHPDPVARFEAWEARLGSDGIAELAEAASEAADGSRRVADVVREMRLLSRVDSDTEGAVDVRGCIDSALRLVHSGLVPRVIIEADEQGSFTVSGNPGLLSQVFVNLFLNASQAMEASGEGSTIQVKITREDEQIIVRVSDDGPGVPPELASRIFEPFVSTKPAGKGTGLGLAICRDIADRHGGTLGLDPSAKTGAAFVLCLRTA